MNLVAVSDVEYFLCERLLLKTDSQTLTSWICLSTDFAMAPGRKKSMLRGPFLSESFQSPSFIGCPHRNWCQCLGTNIIFINVQVQDIPFLASTEPAKFLRKHIFKHDLCDICDMIYALWTMITISWCLVHEINSQLQSRTHWKLYITLTKNT